EFRRLEATWLGLHYLVQHTETSENLKIRVLNVSKEQLREDLAAGDFHQSLAYRTLFTERSGKFAGEPVGLLIDEPFGLFVGDYEFNPSPEDVALLQGLARLAAAAEAPFVAAASPRMYGIEHFSEMGRPHDLFPVFTGAGHAAWQAFRDSPKSRY